MQKLLDKEEIIERKNMFLQPIFRDIKSMIKHMTFTDEFKTLKEYVTNRNLILSTYPKKSEIAE